MPSQNSLPTLAPRFAVRVTKAFEHGGQFGDDTGAGGSADARFAAATGEAKIRWADLSAFRPLHASPCGEVPAQPPLLLR